jgi:hypothetical protein
MKYFECAAEGCDRKFDDTDLATINHHLDMHMLMDAITDAAIGIVEALEGEEVETEEAKKEEEEKPAMHFPDEIAWTPRTTFFKKK